MLHHFDKSDLQAYTLHDLFDKGQFDQKEYHIEEERFAPILPLKVMFGTVAEIVQASRDAMLNIYMK